MRIKKISLTEQIGSVLKGAPKEGLCLKDLVNTLEYRAHAIVIIILCLPFCTPIPLPGASSIIAVFIFFIAGAILFRLPPYLPFGWESRRFDCGRLLKIYERAEPWLRKLELVLRPRWLVLAAHPAAVRVHGLLIILTAVLLALPAPPGGNALPGLAIMALCLALIEEDGVLSVVGFGLVAVNFVLFSALYYFVIEWAMSYF